jgi:G3E family GTPase
MPRTEPLPLLLLTGFLGSGKTSTLSHWLAHTDASLKKTAVIINDFGAVNVDAALLTRRQLELRSITGGCVCCQSYEDLVAQVGALADNPEIVIRRMVLVVDGSDFPCSWRGRAVQEEQIRYADVILLNKTDRLDASALKRIEISLRQINPAARIVATQKGAVEPAILSGDGARVAAPAHHHDDCDCGHDHAHGHDHDHHHDKMPHSASTLFIALSAPVERAAFQRFLGSLPASVFRAKGFIRLAESPEKLHTFQQVRDQTELLLLPLEDSEQLATGLVLIGPHLEEERIRDLARVLTPAYVP